VCVYSFDDYCYRISNNWQLTSHTDGYLSNGHIVYRPPLQRVCLRRGVNNFCHQFNAFEILLRSIGICDFGKSLGTGTPLYCIICFRKHRLKFQNDFTFSHFLVYICYENLIRFGRYIKYIFRIVGN